MAQDITIMYVVYTINSDRTYHVQFINEDKNAASLICKQIKHRGQVPRCRCFHVTYKDLINKDKLIKTILAEMKVVTMVDGIKLTLT